MTIILNCVPTVVFRIMNRYRFLITGTVQGVGFRPTVYRVARELGLTGWVYNDAQGVTVEAQGEHANQFIKLLRRELPRLAQIDHVHEEPIELVEEEREFRIVKSQNAHRVGAKISPDVATCDDCLGELFNPHSRFYLYPFLNCTNCGPRLTITRQLPYDRSQTAMSVFPMCGVCQNEYEDPLDRRYHAQPTACEKCGPRLSDDIPTIARQIRDGNIVAIKGVGGYQLICDARNEQAVKRLRERKERDAKPFALMVLNAASAEQLIQLSLSEKQLLKSWQRPIVLLKKRKRAGDRMLLSDEVAKGLNEYGIMLPYSPIHYLLFHDLLGRPAGMQWLREEQPIILIATSANISGEPLITHDVIAKENLKAIADLIVSYNRDIVTRADDSVTRVVAGSPYFIRRARGYVPAAIKLPNEVPPILATGAFLKNTVCVTRGDEAFVSQYLGDMDNEQTIEFFHETVDHLLHVLDVKPEIVVHDLHPDFYTTKFAETFGVQTVGVQHHHAHLFAVAAENRLTERAIGLALDGYGYGERGEAWGGELMLLDHGVAQRLGSLLPLPQPGGDIAAREPWRMAVAVLDILNRQDQIVKRFGACPQIDALQMLLNKGTNVGMTSSAGRLFDAASALLGVALYNRYEGEAPMQLEALVIHPQVLTKGWSIDQSNYLNFLPLLSALLSYSPAEGANIFHGTLIAGLSDWVGKVAKQYQTKNVLLSGGCFLNRVLLEGLLTELRKRGLKPFIHLQLPPNDGCISLGQAWAGGIRSRTQG